MKFFNLRFEIDLWFSIYLMFEWIWNLFFLENLALIFVYFVVRNSAESRIRLFRLYFTYKLREINYGDSKNTVFAI